MSLIDNIFRRSSDKKSLGNFFRQKRNKFFNEQLHKLPRPVKILDVGGSENFWLNNAEFINIENIEITILNLDLPNVSHKNFIAHKGDATNLSEFKDDQFDIVFSNSVIEHLYTKENQILMANEIRRVGKYHFVQTPNKFFFMEPHYLLPFFQFIPKKIRFIILTRTKLSRMRRWPEDKAKRYLDEIRLLSKSEFQDLFPNDQVWKENFLGLNKSFIAHNFK